MAVAVAFDVVESVFAIEKTVDGVVSPIRYLHLLCHPKCRKIRWRSFGNEGNGVSWKEKECMLFLLGNGNSFFFIISFLRISGLDLLEHSISETREDPDLGLPQTLVSITTVAYVSAVNA